MSLTNSIYSPYQQVSYYIIFKLLFLQVDMFYCRQNTRIQLKQFLLLWDMMLPMRMIWMYYMRCWNIMTTVCLLQTLPLPSFSSYMHSWLATKVNIAFCFCIIPPFSCNFYINFYVPYTKLLRFRGHDCRFGCVYVVYVCISDDKFVKTSPTL